MLQAPIRHQFTATVLIALCMLPMSASQGGAATTLIHSITVVSPERSAPLENAWVLLEDETIADVGSGAPPEHADTVIDGANRYLVPGLIDSHVHLYHATGLKRRYTGKFEELRAEFFAQQPRSFLYHGFTTVIELNADFRSNARFTKTDPHPRLFHCGQGAVLSGGFMSLEVEDGNLGKAYPGYFIDHHARDDEKTSRVPGHSPEDAVRHIAERGGICVKAYYEEALWWPRKPKPDFALPTDKIMRELVEAAHTREMPVILHATTPRGHRFALDTGVDVLAHGMWEWPGQRFDAPMPKPDYEKIATEVAQSSLHLQPTFSTIRNTRSLFQPEVLADDAWQNVVPSTFRAYLTTAAEAQKQDFENLFGPLLEKNAPGQFFRNLQRDFNLRYERLIGRMANQGANLLFGTDTAVGGFGFAAPPGLAGYWEMQAWVRAGIPLQTLFNSLTLANARAFNLDDRLGTVEPGKTADLLILRQNPLKNVSAYDAIEMIILNGEFINRETLAANR
ncbi:amidohydrolase family protein [Roseibium sp. SCP14]|uniref:amidohydrolase family protein n=1 Tax=Roseibium sp. SCP14 TaxID=3141375 RepID=UPI003336AD73